MEVCGGCRVWGAKVVSVPSFLSIKHEYALHITHINRSLKLRGMVWDARFLGCGQGMVAGVGLRGLVMV